MEHVFKENIYLVVFLCKKNNGASLKNFGNTAKILELWSYPKEGIFFFVLMFIKLPSSFQKAFTKYELNLYSTI